MFSFMLYALPYASRETFLFLLSAVFPNYIPHSRCICSFKYCIPAPWAGEISQECRLHTIVCMERIFQAVEGTEKLYCDEICFLLHPFTWSFINILILYIRHKPNVLRSPTQSVRCEQDPWSRCIEDFVLRTQGHQHFQSKVLSSLPN